MIYKAQGKEFEYIQENLAESQGSFLDRGTCKILFWGLSESQKSFLWIQNNYKAKTMQTAIVLNLDY